MARKILFLLTMLSSFNGFAFEWQGYNSELVLARELSNAQIIAKAPNVEEARKNLDQLLKSLSSNTLTTGTESSDQFLLGLTQLGLLSLNRLTLWSHVGTKGKDIWLNSKEFKTQNAIITEHYVKGLNHAISTGEKIDPQWLYIITASTILDTQVREAVIKYEMNLNKNRAPTETYFWDSYSSIYEAYLNKKDYDNASRILDEMASKFPNLIEKVNKARQAVQQYVDKHNPPKPEVVNNPKVEAMLEKVESQSQELAAKSKDEKQEAPIEKKAVSSAR